MCTNTQKHLVRDEWTGRYFESNMTEIQQAVLETNAFLLEEGDVDLNTFYDRLNIEGVPQGADMGWSGDSLIALTYGAGITGPASPFGVPQGVPYISISFRNEPKSAMSVR